MEGWPQDKHDDKVEPWQGLRQETGIMLAMILSEDIMAISNDNQPVEPYGPS